MTKTSVHSSLLEVHQIQAGQFTIFAQTVVLNFRVNPTVDVTHILHKVAFLETFSTDAVQVFVVMFVNMCILTGKFTHSILYGRILRTFLANGVEIEKGDVLACSLALGCS